MAQRDICKLQPLHDVVCQLLEAWLIGADLRQPPHSATLVATIWMYPGPGYSDRIFSVELDNAEIDTQGRRILSLGGHRNSSPSPIPLREGVASPWVSPLNCVNFCLFCYACCNTHFLYHKTLPS
jgi:hypothetical protein